MSKRDMQQLLRRLRRAGYAVEKRSTGHVCVNTPGGPVFGAATPSDWRAFRNFIADLKKRGVPVEVLE